MNRIIRTPNGCLKVRQALGTKFHVFSFDPWDMLNNFCFHVLAQKSLFIAENCNPFFDIISSSITLSCDFRVHRAGQLYEL